jgi:hypothetical protein
MKKTIAILAASLLASLSASAGAQTPSGSAVADSPTLTKQHTDGEGPPMIGPGSGAYKEFSDPKGWERDAEAWHKQHTAAATDDRSAPSGLDASAAK